jgi:CHRD domain
MLSRFSIGALAAVALLAGAACDDDATGPGADEFEATLTAAAERPNPVTTIASGTASIDINDSNSTIDFSVSVTGLVNPTVAHIHIGGVDVAGPPVVTLLATPPAAGTFTGVLASGTINAAMITGGETFATLVAKIRSGEAYINVHTTANPGGEIRGQLVED